MPKISVVMPVYNGEKYLKEAIDSILNQTFTDFEFIIIDDGSTDKTEQIIKSYDDKRILYIKNEKNLGVAESLNKGLDMAQGEYIARMDADDISMPKRFEKQIDFMDVHCEYGVCGTGVIIFQDDEYICQRMFSESHKALRVDLIFGNALAHPTVMIRKSISESVLLRYDEDFEKAEDYELWTRISNNIQIHSIKEPLLKYRIHENQVSTSSNTQQRNAAMNVRYNVMKRILGNSADKYIVSFNKYFENEELNSAEYENLVDCLNAIKAANRIKKEYNQRILCEQILYVKHSLADKYNRKVSITSFFELIMFMKINLSKILRKKG